METGLPKHLLEVARAADETGIDTVRVADHWIEKTIGTRLLPRENRAEFAERRSPSSASITSW